ncbi:gamma-aminobutyric acid receptor subunit alpha-6-like isoform X2 [Portunus trituberculatus]|uniref:gamma-aminobutyric acid receptor subunit alpha-6-like isoform X2 n=1 Tax=Portunus trituberculatus TaxID=210409 RepID=UPI001E1CCCD1|nr:gamma-aminobutyric acid receptor subunit alpha-6-like isoform X2 [Portunus trituberculatus]
MVGNERGMWWWWWWRWWCVVVVLSAVLGRSQAYSSTYSASGFSKNVTNLLDSLLANYDRRIRPGHGGPPTTIMVNMNVRSMGPFSEKQESYSMQLYLRQVWFDPRLRFNKTDLGETEFSMNWMFAAKLWKPDTFFINGKNSYAHKITAPNTFIRLQHDGQITWSLRLTVRATCKMHLRKFPLDTQLCPLSLASYGYNSQDMVYKWAPSTVTVDPDVSIAQYELFNISTGKDKIVVQRKEEISILSVKFHLKRLTGFFLLQVYVPCILIVCCSWVAFWITKKDVPGRVCLGITTILTLTKMGFVDRTSLPKLAYPVGMDYFVILCFTYAFAALFEFAMINYLERRATRHQRQMVRAKKGIEDRAKAGSADDELTLAAEKDATMMVTTTVREDGAVDIGASLRDTLRVPLSVVPLSVRPIEEDEVAEAGTPDTETTLKEALKLPLALVPETLTAMKEREEELAAKKEELSAKKEQEASKKEEVVRLRSAAASPVRQEGEEDSGSGGMDASVVSGEIDPMLGSVRAGLPLSGSDSGSVTSKGSLFKFKKDSKLKKDKSQDSESDLTVIKVEIQSEDEDTTALPPPPPPYTIWQILMRKKKLISEMSLTNNIPTEEDILERFSIIDLYARRLFPTSFFILFTIYWVLFNYYITDEFPHEDVPTESLDKGSN